MSSPTQGMWACEHGTDGRDYCAGCHQPRGGLSHADCVRCGLPRDGECSAHCHPEVLCQGAYFIEHDRCGICPKNGEGFDGICHERTCHPGLICKVAGLPPVPANPMFSGMARYSLAGGNRELDRLHVAFAEACGCDCETGPDGAGPVVASRPWASCSAFTQMRVRGIGHTVYVVWDGDFGARIVDITDDGPAAALCADISVAWENAADAMREAAEKVIEEVRAA